MKTINLGNRVIFVDNIKSIYQSEDNYGDDVFRVETKDNKAYKITKDKYYEIQEYLLSLNKEDKSPLSEVQRLFNKLDNSDQEYVLNILRLFNEIPTPENIEK